MAVARKIPKIMEEPTAFCAGCGHGILNRLIAEVLEEKGQEKNHILILGVGCNCNMNFTWGGDKLQCAHGRATSVARGAKTGRPDTLIISYQGDGDAYVIGLSDTINTAYVNTNVTTFAVNNTNYAMTGGQMSWTTMPGQHTTTSASGRDCESTGNPIKVPEIIAQNFDVAYVARGSLHSAKEINKTKKYVRNAIEAQLNGEGFSLVEVLAQCPTNWKVSTVDANEWLKDKVVPIYPLGEFKKREGRDDK
jgi:2-oxoglutarate ferredoxin oxidoreductase subunit beta